MDVRRILPVLLSLFLQDVSGLIRVCYFTNWSQHRPGVGKFLPENIDPFLCSHIVYAYAWLSGNQLVPTQSNDESSLEDPGQYSKVTQLKELNPELRVLLSVGGWNAGSLPFSNMVSSLETRTEFINSTIQFLRDRDFDGIDLDWEYPGIRRGRSTDKANLNSLLKEMRSSFIDESVNTGNEMLLITAVVPPGKFFTHTGYDIPVVTSMLDFIHVRTYDYHGSWESRVGHPSPLYHRTNETGDDALRNMHSSIQYWLSLGTPKEKLVASIALYGRSFTLLDGADFEIGAPDNGSGPAAPYTQEPGFISYYEICDMLNKGAVRYWHDEHKVPYLVNGTTWVGYDDAESISLKVRWLKDIDIGGVMVWAMDLDDYTGQFCGQGILPLLTTVNLKLVERRFGIKNEPVNITKQSVNSTIRAFIESMLESKTEANDVLGMTTLNISDNIPASILELADTVKDINAAIQKKTISTGTQINEKGFQLGISKDNYSFPFNAALEGAKDNESTLSYLQKIIRGNPNLNTTHISNENFVKLLAQYVSGIKMSSTSKEKSTEIIKTSPRKAKLRLVETVKSGVFSPVLSQANTLARLDMQPEISFSVGNKLSSQSAPFVSSHFEIGNMNSNIKTAGATNLAKTKKDKSLTEQHSFPVNTQPAVSTVNDNSLTNKNMMSVKSDSNRTDEQDLLPGNQTLNSLQRRKGTKGSDEIVNLNQQSNINNESTIPSDLQQKSDGSVRNSLKDASQQQNANMSFVDKLSDITEIVPLVKAKPSLSDNAQLANVLELNTTDQVSGSTVVNENNSTLSKQNNFTKPNLQSAYEIPLADSKNESSTVSSRITYNDSLTDKGENALNTLQPRQGATDSKQEVVEIQNNMTVKEQATLSETIQLPKGLQLTNTNRMPDADVVDQTIDILSRHNMIAETNLKLENTTDIINHRDKNINKHKHQPDPMDDMLSNILAIPLLPSDPSPPLTNTEATDGLYKTNTSQETVNIMPIIKQLEHSFDLPQTQYDIQSLNPEAGPAIHEYNYKTIGITNDQTNSYENASGDNVSNSSQLPLHLNDQDLKVSDMQMTNGLGEVPTTGNIAERITSPQKNTQTPSEVVSEQKNQFETDPNKNITFSRNNDKNINNFNDTERRMYEFEPSSIFHNGMKLKSMSTVDSSKILQVSPSKAKLQLLTTVDSGVFTPLLSGELSSTPSKTRIDVSNMFPSETNSGVSYEIENRVDANQNQNFVMNANGLDNESKQSNMQHTNQDPISDNMQTSETIGIDTRKAPLQENEPWYITLLKYNQGLKLKSQSMTQDDKFIKTSPKRAKLRHVETVRTAVFSPTILQMNQQDQLQ